MSKLERIMGGPPGAEAQSVLVDQLGRYGIPPDTDRDHFYERLRRKVSPPEMNLNDLETEITLDRGVDGADLAIAAIDILRGDREPEILDGRPRPIVFDGIDPAYEGFKFVIGDFATNVNDVEVPNSEEEVPGNPYKIIDSAGIAPTAILQHGDSSLLVARRFPTDSDVRDSVGMVYRGLPGDSLITSFSFDLPAFRSGPVLANAVSQA